MKTRHPQLATINAMDTQRRRIAKRLEVRRGEGLPGEGDRLRALYGDYDRVPQEDCNAEGQ